MIVVKSLIWDEWNREHIYRHGITEEEVEEICHGKHETFKTFRGRIGVEGKTSSGRHLRVILSPEDRLLQSYGEGIYYPITAFEKGGK